MKRETWHNNFLLSLRELADPEAQRRSWLHGDESRIPPPVELLSQVFDDSGIADLLDEGLVFSDKADKALSNLNRLTTGINLDQPLEKLLGSELWLQITRLAATALRAIEESLED